MGKEKKLTQQEAPLHGIHHKRRKSLVVRTLCFIFAASFAIIFLFPTVVTIANSFMSQSEISSNYGMVFSTTDSGKINSVVGHASLWEIVGSDFLRAVSRTNLASTCIRLSIMRLLALHLIELGSEYRKSLILVLYLRLLCLAVYNDTRRVMCKTNR